MQIEAKITLQKIMNRNKSFSLHDYTKADQPLERRTTFVLCMCISELRIARSPLVYTVNYHSHENFMHEFLLE